MDSVDIARLRLDATQTTADKTNAGKTAASSSAVDHRIANVVQDFERPEMQAVQSVENTPFHSEEAIRTEKEAIKPQNGLRFRAGDMRNAVILSEVLAPPVSKRRP